MKSKSPLPSQAYTSVGLATSEERMVQSFMCALDLINLVYEVVGLHTAGVPDGWGQWSILSASGPPN